MCSLSLSLALIEIDCCECYDLKTLGRRLMIETFDSFSGILLFLKKRK